MKRRVLYIWMILMLLIIIFSIKFYFGCFDQEQVIVGTIVSENDDYYIVDTSDETYCGEYFVPKQKDAASLGVGDVVEISFIGDIWETYPAHFEKVTNIKKVSSNSSLHYK